MSTPPKTWLSYRRQPDDPRRTSGVTHLVTHSRYLLAAVPELAVQDALRSRTRFSWRFTRIGRTGA